MLFAVCSRFASSSVVLTRVGKAALLILALLCSEACARSTFTPYSAAEGAYGQIAETAVLVYPGDFNYLLAADVVIVGSQQTSGPARMSADALFKRGATDAARNGATHIVLQAAWNEVVSQGASTVNATCSQSRCTGTVTEGTKYYSANNSYLLLRVDLNNWKVLPPGIQPLMWKKLDHLQAGRLAAPATAQGGTARVAEPTPPAQLAEQYELISGGLGIVLGESMDTFEGTCARLNGGFSLHGVVAKCLKPQVKNLEFEVDEIEVESCNAAICLITARSVSAKLTSIEANNNFEEMLGRLSIKYGPPNQSVQLSRDCVTDLSACYGSGSYKRSSLWGREDGGRLLFSAYQTQVEEEWYANYMIVYLNNQGFEKLKQRDL